MPERHPERSWRVCSRLREILAPRISCRCISDNVQIAISVQFTTSERIGQNGASQLTFCSVDPNALSVILFRARPPPLFLLIEFHYAEAHPTFVQSTHAHWMELLTLPQDENLCWQIVGRSQLLLFHQGRAGIQKFLSLLVVSQVGVTSCSTVRQVEIQDASCGSHLQQ